MKASTQSSFDSRVEALKDSAKHLVDVGGDRVTRLKSATVAQADRISMLIKQHPFAGVAIAFGVGYLAMRLVRR